jgi:hypothetical protein
MKHTDQIFCIRKILEMKWEYNETIRQEDLVSNLGMEIVYMKHIVKSVWANICLRLFLSKMV